MEGEPADAGVALGKKGRTPWLLADPPCCWREGERLLENGWWWLGVGMENSQMQVRGIRIYRMC
jgi:hypothetical protein